MLDKVTYKTLKMISRNLYVSREKIDNYTKFQEKNQNNPHISFLLECHYIKMASNDDIKDAEGMERYYQVTLHGIAFIQENRKNGAKFWVPYIITTGIAIMSLLISLLPYFLSCN